MHIETGNRINNYADVPANASQAYFWGIEVYLNYDKICSRIAQRCEDEKIVDKMNWISRKNREDIEYLEQCYKRALNCEYFHFAESQGQFIEGEYYSETIPEVGRLLIIKDQINELVERMETFKSTDPYAILAIDNDEKALQFCLSLHQDMAEAVGQFSKHCKQQRLKSSLCNLAGIMQQTRDLHYH